MSPERWQKVKNILHEVLEKPSRSRAAFINEECGADAELRREVESLLLFESSEERQDIFENGFLSSILTVDENKTHGFIGRQIGKYRIIRELGAGGMGVVFLAERVEGEFEQKAAIKFLRQSFCSQTAINRFLSERRILSRLQHPYIAQFIDGGATADGTPYLVMEYVEGTPITVYAEERNLELSERIELFRKVCTAVSFAHRNLIVHRDLKPENILITGDGTPKLLDFGIAKLLTESEIKATVTRLQAFTPEYASPEQIGGKAITTASDVYVLGIILFELLSGTRPFRVSGSDSHAEIWRVVNDTEPPRPSSIVSIHSSASENKTGSKTGQNEEKRPAKNVKQTANPKAKILNPKSLKGDLDNIVLKALKREPERRYATVEQMSDDLRRYKAGLPVSARPDTYSYRLTKFVGRNRIVLTAAVLIFISLSFGIISTFQQSQRAERERLRAEAKAENLRKISKTLIFDVHDAIRHLPGSLPAREMLLGRAVEQLNELAEDAHSSAELREELAQAFYNVGEMQQALGNVSAAEESYGKAIAIYEKLAAENPRKPEYLRGLANGYGLLANIAYMRGEAGRSSEFFAKSLPIAENLARENPNNIEILEESWNAHHNYGISLIRLGKYGEALIVGQRALKIAEKITNSGDSDAGRRQVVNLTEGFIGAAQSMAGNYEQAIPQFEKTIAEAERLQAEFPSDTRFQYNLWAFNRRLGITYVRTKQFDDARKTLEKSLFYIEGLMDGNPKDAGYKRNTSITLMALAQAFLDEGEYKQALPLLFRSLELSESLFASDPNNGETINDLASIYGNLSAALAHEGRFNECFAFYEKSIQNINRLLAKNAENVQIKRDYAETLQRMAVEYAQSAGEKTSETAKKLRNFSEASIEKKRQIQF